MRSVEDHLTLVTAAAVAPRPVRVAISEAQGLMCAEEVVTERPMPGFDQAAIDGYAVRSVDVRSDDGVSEGRASARAGSSEAEGMDRGYAPAPAPPRCHAAALRRS